MDQMNSTMRNTPTNLPLAADSGRIIGFLGGWYGSRTATGHVGTWWAAALPSQASPSPPEAVSTSSGHLAESLSRPSHVLRSHFQVNKRINQAICQEMYRLASKHRTEPNQDVPKTNRSQIEPRLNVILCSRPAASHESNAIQDCFKATASSTRLRCRWPPSTFAGPKMPKVHAIMSCEIAAFVSIILHMSCAAGRFHHGEVP